MDLEATSRITLIIKHIVVVVLLSSITYYAHIADADKKAKRSGRAVMLCLCGCESCIIISFSLLVLVMSAHI
jgi:hypothetical protein